MNSKNHVWIILQIISVAFKHLHHKMSKESIYVEFCGNNLTNPPQFASNCIFSPLNPLKIFSRSNKKRSNESSRLSEQVLNVFIRNSIILPLYCKKFMIEFIKLHMCSSLEHPWNDTWLSISCSRNTLYCIC